MATLDMHNVVSSVELANIIKTSASAIIANPSLSHVIPPTLVRGAPGVGKSTIVRAVADELGIDFIDMRLSEMERVDVAGLPSVDKGTTIWNVPSILPQNAKSKGILLLDEITAAPADVQVAAYQLVLDRCISNSNYKLPDGWYIVAAGNRTIDRAVARPLSSALANRFAHYELEAKADDWNLWAVAHDIHPSVTGFIKFRPELLFKMDTHQNLEAGWPSPRSWERAANIIPLFKDNETVLQKAIYGIVGQNVGIEFLAFYKTASKFDDVLEVMRNSKAKIKIPSRSDEKAAYASAAVYHVWNGKNEKDQAKLLDGFYRIVLEMDDDFAAMMIKGAAQGNSHVSRLDAITAIRKSPRYKDFDKKFGKKLTEKYSLDLNAM